MSSNEIVPKFPRGRRAPLLMEQLIGNGSELLLFDAKIAPMSWWVMLPQVRKHWSWGSGP